MSEVITGVIDGIHTKEVQTKFGAKSVYIASVNGHEVNLGFKTGLSQGESVSLNVEHKYGSYQLIQGSPSTAGTAAGPAKAALAPTAAPTAAPRTAFPIANNTKDTSIIRQSSLNRAVDVTRDLSQCGLFTASDESAYLDKILEVAYLFTDFGTGQREMKQAEAMACYEGRDV